MKSTLSSRLVKFHAGQLVRPRCPQCTEQQFASDASVHVNDNDIRHWWSCESCGHQFMTTVTLWRKASGHRSFS